MPKPSEDAPTEATPAEAPSVEAPSVEARPEAGTGDEDRIPGPSKMRYLALLFAGMFIGRIATTNFSAGALNLLDLVMYAGLALSLAWAWRSWARQAMIQRHLAAERRRQRTSAAAPRPPRRPKR